MSVCCEKCGSVMTPYKQHRCKPVAVTLPNDGELCVLLPVAKVAWWCDEWHCFCEIGSRDRVESGIINEWIGLGRKSVIDR